MAKKTVKDIAKEENNKEEFSKQQLVDTLRMMMTARAIDNKAMNFLRQGKTFFHIAGAGHEAIQAAIGQQLNKENDWFFPYYRNLTLHN